ncbi:MAG: hypothetical protein JSC085_000048 [Candidatus Tokpelaia sp. JSC085]|nr:MAG: hypothetical protein JSC085_000048 [Candidatus Tokpelaia sp. JSC085]
MCSMPSKNAVLFLLVIMMMLSTPSGANEDTTAHIVVMAPWARAAEGQSRVGSGYLTINNHSETPDRLMAVRSDIAAFIEIHEMHVENNIMQMRKIVNGLEIAAHGTVVLQPGGYHLMFFDLHQPFKKGDSFNASLEFEKAGTAEVIFTIRSYGK